MRTFSDSDLSDLGRSSPSPSAGTIISLPDSSDDDDFELILMPSTSQYSESSYLTSDLSVTSGLGSFSLSGDEDLGTDFAPGTRVAESPEAQASSPESLRALLDSLEDISLMASSSPSPSSPLSSQHSSHPLSTQCSPSADSSHSSEPYRAGRLITFLGGENIDTSSASVPRSIDIHHPSRSPPTPSILSASDARESIDSFFTDPAFTKDKANMLRLWQSLCVELGLVALDDGLLDLPLDARSASSVYGSPSGSESDTDDDDETPTASRSVTPTPTATATPTLPPLPTSLRKASQLLHAHAHVIIGDYLAARADPGRQGEDVVGKYADLVYPNAAALVRALRRERKFTALNDVKREWLQPLLKDLGFRRR